MIRSKLVSTGFYVPSRTVKNAEFVQWMETSDEWIEQRSGIKERRWVTKDDTTLSMAKAASVMAIEKAGLKVDDIDAIIFGCLLADYIFPGTGCLLQRELGFQKPIPALDIRNQCSAFIYSLSIADAWIRSGKYKRILIVGSETHSTSMDLTTRGRDIAVLFGDGAGACIIEACDEKQPHIIDTLIYSEGQYADNLAMPYPTPNDHPRLAVGQVIDERIYPVMDGRLVFKNAVTRMCEVILEILKKNNYTVADVDFVVAHQANLRINQMVMNQLGIPDTKTHNTVDHYGNTTAATIPITFNEALELGKVKRGDLVVFVAFGSGFTWGATLVRY